MLDRLTSQDFSAHLNQPFCIREQSMEPLDATLIEVTELGANSEDAARQAFSIILRVPKEIVLPQSIYRVEHAALGALDLFLVPLGPDNEGMRYEAVFT